MKRKRDVIYQGRIYYNPKWPSPWEVSVTYIDSRGYDTVESDLGIGYGVTRDQAMENARALVDKHKEQVAASKPVEIVEF